MKVILALSKDDAKVIGLLVNTEDEVVYMNNWLRNCPLDGFRPTGFRVYNFCAGDPRPMVLGTMQYVVNGGKVG